MGTRRRADRGRVEQRLLILVTLGLVAFGLVMVFSATSASATLGECDPMRFLVKQGLYAVAGLVLLAVLSRVDYHVLRPLAPMLLVTALVLCAAVLVFAPAINGAHRWFLFGPVSVQPAELAKPRSTAAAQRSGCGSCSCVVAAAIATRCVSAGTAAMGVVEAVYAPSMISRNVGPGIRRIVADGRQSTREDHGTARERQAVISVGIRYCGPCRRGR